MTRTQASALQLLIEADRQYWQRRIRGEPVSPDDRGIEIWAQGPIAHSTARALERAGVAELTDSRRNSSLWLYLGSCDVPSL